jgi:hypothetical protein
LVLAVLETHQVALELMVRILYFLLLLRLVAAVVLVMGLTHP